MVDAGSKEIVFSAVFSSKTIKISTLPYSMLIVSIITKTNTLMQRTLFTNHIICVYSSGLWFRCPEILSSQALSGK